MQRWQLAARRYRQIVPQPVLEWSDFPFRQINIWLRRDVCPVVEEFSRRPKFREAATRSLRAFAEDAKGQERVQVESLAAAVQNYVRALLKLVDKARIRRKLIELYPPQMQIASESVVIGDSGRMRTEVATGLVDALSIELNQVRQMADAPSKKLVKIEDYLQPVQEFIEMPDGTFIQRGEMIVSLTPELPPVGDFIVACLFRRVEIQGHILEAVFQKTLAAARQCGRRYDALAESIVAAKNEYVVSRRALEVAFQTGQENVLSDSCVILTQVYAAFHPEPDVTWLGLPKELIERGAISIRAHFTHNRNAEMFDRIAAALEDLRWLYDPNSPDQTAIDEAIATGGLVIVKNPPSLHWEGALVEANWRGNPWELVNALARRALLGSFVEAKEVFPNSHALTMMSTNAARLKEMLPHSLRRLIAPGELPRTYRLDLEPERIHIFA